jgi:hypothetical protein
MLDIVTYMFIYATYCRLDSTNISEFLIKWQKGKGLDPVENLSHKEYLHDVCQEMVIALQEKISAAAECLEQRVRDKVCQEVMHHGTYCKKKATTFMVSARQWIYPSRDQGHCFASV